MGTCHDVYWLIVHKYVINYIEKTDEYKYIRRRIVVSCIPNGQDEVHVGVTSTRCSACLKPKLWTLFVEAALSGALCNRVCVNEQSRQRT